MAKKDDMLYFDLGETDMSSGLETPEVEKKVVMKKTKNKHRLYRAFSEVEILDCIDRIDFQENDCCHFITYGDVDSYSYIQAMIRFQNFNELTFSTWCMALEDVKSMERMVDSKKIKVLNANVGEIFKGAYPQVYEAIVPLVKRTGGYFNIFRNHAKVYIARGEKFDFVVESSANINTNPRAEQTTITVSKELADFYDDYFRNIKSFGKENE